MSHDDLYLDCLTPAEQERAMYDLAQNPAQ